MFQMYLLKSTKITLAVLSKWAMCAGLYRKSLFKIGLTSLLYLQLPSEVPHCLYQHSKCKMFPWGTKLVLGLNILWCLCWWAAGETQATEVHDLPGLCVAPAILPMFSMRHAGTRIFHKARKHANHSQKSLITFGTEYVVLL